jgi:hypothetical protein
LSRKILASDSVSTEAAAVAPGCKAGHAQALKGLWQFYLTIVPLQLLQN